MKYDLRYSQPYLHDMGCSQTYLAANGHRKSLLAWGNFGFIVGRKTLQLIWQMNLHTALDDVTNPLKNHTSFPSEACRLRHDSSAQLPMLSTAQGAHKLHLALGAIPLNSSICQKIFLEKKDLLNCDLCSNLMKLFIIRYQLGSEEAPQQVSN